jgi:hypothetical protein
MQLALDLKLRDALRSFVDARHVASPAGGPTPQVTDMFARGPDLDGPWFESIRALYCAQR